jgi:hypothetical protein
MQLSQSEWIAVAILAGFLIYLSIKGKLAAYWTLLTGGAAGGAAAAGASPAATAGAQVGAVSSTATSAAGGVAGAVAGPALPGVTSGTVTQGGQTTQQYFPNIPGVNLNNPMSMVTF